MVLEEYLEKKNYYNQTRYMKITFILLLILSSCSSIHKLTNKESYVVKSGGGQEWSTKSILNDMFFEETYGAQVVLFGEFSIRKNITNSDLQKKRVKNENNKTSNKNTNHSR